MSETIETVPVESKKRKARELTPTDEFNLCDLCINVSNHWLQQNQITLLWTNQTEFAATTNQFSTLINQKQTSSGARKAMTDGFKTLEKKIRSHAEYLKVYLKEKYGKNEYVSYLPQFGIFKKGSSYSFPIDRSKLKDSLKLCVAAVQNHGLQEKEYGLTFWQDILTDYESKLSLTNSADSSIAEMVKLKTTCRAKLSKTLNALIHVIRGNYPDTYASELREWGFQKEKY